MAFSSIRRVLRRCVYNRFAKNIFLSLHGKISYSQSGEDLIIDFLFSNYLKISKPVYLDIGAHHPAYLSNTYLFYKRGCHGVCVEPDVTLFAKIRNKRKRDKCLNVGIGVTTQSEADFYIMSEKTLNTFSKEEAERYQTYDGIDIERVVRVPLLPINDLLHQHFTKCPDYVSLDVEGLDLDILRTLDFTRYRPHVFCIETLTYVKDNTEQKLDDILAFMKSKDYVIYADTFINTIFVDANVWNNRK